MKEFNNIWTIVFAVLFIFVVAGVLRFVGLYEGMSGIPSATSIKGKDVKVTETFAHLS
jgi:hypothetical protein